MGFLGSFSGQVTISVVCGVAVAATLLPIRELAFMVWLACLVAGWWHRSAVATRSPAREADFLGISLLLMSAICIAAYLAPFKTKDNVLRRQIRLDRLNYTLAELREPSAYDLPPLPVRSTFSFPEALAAQAVHFPSELLSINEFIEAIESQSSLRHKFHSCGNGHTILTGEDCCFGLSFSHRPSGRD